MRNLALTLVLALGTSAMLAACSPKVGSEEWCKDMKAKDKAQWTAQEAADFAKSCVLPK